MENSHSGRGGSSGGDALRVWRIVRWKRGKIVEGSSPGHFIQGPERGSQGGGMRMGMRHWTKTNMWEVVERRRRKALMARSAMMRYS